MSEHRPHLIFVIDGAHDSLGIIEEHNGAPCAVLRGQPRPGKGMRIDATHLLRRLDRWLSGHSHRVECCTGVVVVNDGTFWSQQRRAMSIANTLAWSLSIPVASIQSTQDWGKGIARVWKTLQWESPPLLPLYNALPRITTAKPNT